MNAETFEGTTPISPPPASAGSTPPVQSSRPLGPDTFNWVAIVALVLAPLSAGTAGILFAIAALFFISKGWASNKAVAIWALVLNIVIILVGVIFAMLIGRLWWNLTYPTLTNPAVLKPGHCVAEPSSIDWLAIVDVERCHDPHWGQIYSVGDFHWDTLTGTAEHRQIAMGHCTRALATQDELEPWADPGNVYVYLIYPTESSGSNDITYVCALKTDGAPLPEP